MSYADDRSPRETADQAWARGPDERDFPTLAPEAFAGLPGRIVRAIAPRTESDPNGLLLSLHAYFGNNIGRGPYYLVESTRHFTNIFVAKIGDTAKARKGTGEDRIRAVFRHVDPDWADTRIHTGLSSGEGLIWAVRDPIAKPVKDGKNQQHAEEIADPGVGDKRLLIVESEFSGALRVMGRDGNSLSRVIRDAWDGHHCLESITKLSPGRATGTCISIVGHSTAAEVTRYLERTEVANGFGNRFLWAAVRRSQLLPFGGSELPEAEMRTMAAETRRAVQTAKNIGEVAFSAEAKAGWQKIYPKLSQERPGLLGALTARADAQTVRLAMLNALWRGADEIALEDLSAAVAIWEYCDRSVRYIFGEKLGSPVADTILEALKTAGRDGLTRTEINNLFSRHGEAAKITRALDDLLRYKLIERLEKPTRGRPVEIWRAAT